MMKKLSLTAFAISVSLSLAAQATENPDFIRSTGKIYVVVAVIIALLIGLFLYLFSIERKLGKVEKQLEEY